MSTSSIILIIILNVAVVLSKPNCKIYYPEHTFSSVPQKTLNEFSISHESAIQVKNSENVSVLSLDMLNRHHSTTTVWLSYINLSNNSFESIEAHTFSNISFCLQYLFLDHNKLTNITEYVFKDLFELRKLDLSFNKISLIDVNGFADLYNLDKLILHNNLLKTLPSNIWNGVQNLTFLDLSTNELELSSNMFEKLQKLENLNLQNNSIHFIPSRTFEGLSSLKSLRLDCNNLRMFKFHDLFGLISLKELNISNSKVKNLNENITDSLKISNYFTIILSSFTLNINFNKLVTLPSNIENNANDIYVSSKSKTLNNADNKTDKYNLHNESDSQSKSTVLPIKYYKNTIEKHINISNNILNDTKIQTNLVNEKIFNILNKMTYLHITEIVIIIFTILMVIFLFLKKKIILKNCRQSNVQESERNLITAEENLNIEL